MTERITYARKDNAHTFFWTEDAGRPPGCMEGSVDMCLVMPGPSPYENSIVIDDGYGKGHFEDGTTFQDNKDKAVTQLKADCKEHIYSMYTIEYQSNCTLKVYPAWVSVACAETIALTVKEENRVNDLIVVSTDEQGIEDALETLSWPDQIEPVEPVEVV